MMRENISGGLALKAAGAVLAQSLVGPRALSLLRLVMQWYRGAYTHRTLTVHT